MDDDRSDASGGDNDSADPGGPPGSAAAAGGKRTRMLEAKELASGDLFARNTSVAAERELPLGERAGEEDGARVLGRGSGRGRGLGVWCVPLGSVCMHVVGEHNEIPGVGLGSPV